MKKVKLSTDVQEASDALLLLHRSESDETCAPTALNVIPLETGQTNQKCSLTVPCLSNFEETNCYDAEYVRHHCCHDKKGMIFVLLTPAVPASPCEVWHKYKMNGKCFEVRLQWMEHVILQAIEFVRRININPTDTWTKTTKWLNAYHKHNDLIKDSFAHLYSLRLNDKESSPSAWQNTKKEMLKEVGQLAMRLHLRQSPVEVRDELTRILRTSEGLYTDLEQPTVVTSFIDKRSIETISTWQILGKTLEKFSHLRGRSVQYLPAFEMFKTKLTETTDSPDTLIGAIMKTFFRVVESALTDEEKLTRELHKDEVNMIAKAAVYFTTIASIWVSIFKLMNTAQARVLLENNATSAALFAFFVLLMRKDLAEEYRFYRFIFYPFHRKYIPGLEHLFGKSKTNVTYDIILTKAFKWGCYQWLIAFTGEDIARKFTKPIIPIPLSRSGSDLYNVTAIITLVEKGFTGLRDTMQQNLVEHMGHKLCNLADHSRCLYCQVLQKGFHQVSFLDFMPASYRQSADFNDKIATKWYAELEKYYISVGAQFGPYETHRATLNPAFVPWPELPVHDPKKGFIQVVQLPTLEITCWILKRKHICNCKPSPCRFRDLETIQLPEPDALDPGNPFHKHFQRDHAKEVCGDCKAVELLEAGLITVKTLHRYCVNPN